jgi:hypothetical protein
MALTLAEVTGRGDRHSMALDSGVDGKSEDVNITFSYFDDVEDQIYSVGDCNPNIAINGSLCVTCAGGHYSFSGSRKTKLRDEFKDPLNPLDSQWGFELPGGQIYKIIAEYEESDVVISGNFH